MTEPLLLIPGHMCDARLFRHQIRSLSASATLHLAPPLRENRINATAASILQRAPPRFAVAGLSFGGIVAMEMLRLEPRRITGLALIDTNHLPESAEAAEARCGRLRRVRQGYLEEVMRDEMKPAYLAEGPRKAEILELVMDMALGLGAEIFEQQSLALLGRHDQTETLRRADTPCLVMCGRDDRLCSVERHEEIAALVPGAELEVIPEAGHLSVLEQPGAANQALNSWLRRQ